MSKPTKIWHCKNCNTNFTPTPPNYSCPECHSNMTGPGEVAGYTTMEKRNEEKRYQIQGTVYPSQKCSKCGNIMHRGVLMQELIDARSYFDHEMEIRWSSGTLFKMAAEVTAYACPNCGNVEMRLKKLESNREYVSKAPTS
jgi:predicted RNA-binding Zn-ribbon protein involved in translation (DUF1610 family)